MGGIYAHAACMIAAAGATNGFEGCFRERGSKLTEQVTITQNSSAPKRVTLTSPQQSAPHVSPLRARGWCFQEQLLARRVLVLTGGEVTWKCEQAATHESASWPAAAFRKDGAGVETAERISCFAPYNKWLALVEAYSVRALTRPAGRLPAVSGVVRELILGRPHPTATVPAYLQGETYVAGAFRGTCCARAYSRRRALRTRRRCGGRARSTLCRLGLGRRCWGPCASRSTLIPRWRSRCGSTI